MHFVYCILVCMARTPRTNANIKICQRIFIFSLAIYLYHSFSHSHLLSFSFLPFLFLRSISIPLFALILLQHRKSMHIQKLLEQRLFLLCIIANVLFILVSSSPSSLLYFLTRSLALSLSLAFIFLFVAKYFIRISFPFVCLSSLFIFFNNFFSRDSHTFPTPVLHWKTTSSHFSQCTISPFYLSLTTNFTIPTVCHWKQIKCVFIHFGG